MPGASRARRSFADDLKENEVLYAAEWPCRHDRLRFFLGSTIPPSLRLRCCGYLPRWKIFHPFSKSKRWSRRKILHRRVRLDRAWGRDPDGPISSHYGPWNIWKFWQSPKGDYAGRSAIGESFSTCRSTETPIGGCLFPLGTLKNFQSPTSDRGGKSLVRGCFSTERGQRDPRPAFSSTVTSLPPERSDHSRKCQVRGCVPYGPRERIRDRRLFRSDTFFQKFSKSKRWLHRKICDRRVVLDQPVEKYRDRRVFRSDTFFQKFSKSKRWLHWKICDRRVVLDRPVEKYRDRRLFRSEDTFSKKCSKSKKKKKKKLLTHYHRSKALVEIDISMSSPGRGPSETSSWLFFFSFFPIVQFLRAKRAPVSPRRSVKISARSVHALWLKVEKTASRHLFLPFFVFFGLFRTRKRLSRHPLAISDREEPRSLRYRPASRLDSSTPKKKSPRPDCPWFFYPIRKARWRICATVDGFWRFPTCHRLRPGTVRRAFWRWIRFCNYIPQMS